MASNISEQTVACQSLFSQCLSIRISNKPDWFENRQAEFNLWDSGLRATDGGRISLDHRVRDRPDLCELICDLLDGLHEALQECLRIDKLKALGYPLATEAKYWKSTSDISTLSNSLIQAGDSKPISDIENIDEKFSEQAFSIKTIVGQLTRISTAIRRSGSKFRHQKADMSLKEEEFQDFRAHLTFIILMPAMTNDGDAPRSYMSGQGRLTTVQNRLIQANVIRRNRIIFATRSKKQVKNQVPRQDDKVDVARLPPINLKSITHITRERKQISTDGQRALSPSPQSIRAPSMTQSATEIGSQFDLKNESPKKTSLSTMTRITRTGDNQDYPPCPAAFSDELLQCPYCANLLPIEYQKKKSRWKGHVAQDILPYSCIVEDCETPNNMYQTSEELVEHMRSYHSVLRWICSHCISRSEDHEQFIFKSQLEWESHMKKRHFASFSQAPLHALSIVSQRNMLDVISCPLCAYATNISWYTLDDHILQHLHEFALRCLPWVVNDNDEGSVPTSSSYGCLSSTFSRVDSDDGLLDYPEFSTAECLADLLAQMVDTRRHLKDSKVLAFIRISDIFEKAGIWDRTDSANKSLLVHLNSAEIHRDAMGEIWGTYIWKIGQIFHQLSLVDHYEMDVMEIALEAKEVLEMEFNTLDNALLQKERESTTRESHERDLVCFGMVTKITGICSSAPFTFKFPVRFESATSFVGTEDPICTGTVSEEHSTVLQAFLDESSLHLHVNCTVAKQIDKSKGNEDRPIVSSPCVLEIMIYGPPSLYDDIGIFLTEHDICLQDPVDSIRNVRYSNPHKLSSVDPNSEEVTAELTKQSPNPITAPGRSVPQPVSAAARHIMESAFDEFDQKITPADSQKFRTTTLQHVRDVALEIEEQLAARGSLRNMRLLAPLFKGIEHYSRAMDVLCNGTPYMPCVWAPIAVVLRVTAEYLKAFEQVLKGYARLADEFVTFIMISDSTFRNDDDVQQTLAVFYANIIQFHTRTYKLVKRCDWKLLFLPSWNRFQGRFDHIREDMRRQGDLLNKAADAHHVAELQEMRRKTRLWGEERIEKLKNLEEEQDTKQHQSISSWMRLDRSDQMAIFDSIMGDGHDYPNTCNWILENSKVRSWLQKRPGTPILWLQGSLGSGKSVISKHLVTFLQATGALVLYHFCSHLYKPSTTHEQILKSLVEQLLRNDGDLIAYVYEEFVLGKKLSTTSALDELLQLLLKNVSDQSSQTECFWIVLDGVHECEPNTQARIVSLMNQVTSHRSLSGQAVCKVLISSRSSTTLSRGLYEKQIVSLTEEQGCLNRAIWQYAAQRLQILEHKFHQLNITEAEWNNILHHVAKKADGMFLYARLVLDRLSTNVFHSFDEIEASVNQPPERIYEFFREILMQMLAPLDIRSVNKIKSVLGWIAFAKCPLKTLELLSALTFSAGDPNAARLTPQYVLDICAPLINERHDKSLTFIHASLKEFLQTPYCSLNIQEQEALEEHGIAAITCLLSGLEVFNESYDIKTRYNRVVRGLHGFHVYATEYWTEYLLSRAEDISGLENNSTLFSMACQMADKLNAGHSLSTIEQIETKSGVQDERLAYLQQHPILCKQVRAALDARSIKQLEHELLQLPVSPAGGIPKPSQVSTPSHYISALLQTYQVTIRSILGQSDLPGISAEELELFKSQFRASAYTCRLKSCPRATLGFETENSCLEHELTHVRKFQCVSPGCHFPIFASAEALKNHVNKHHSSNPARTSIGDVVAPSGPSKAC